VISLYITIVIKNEMNIFKLVLISGCDVIIAKDFDGDVEVIYEQVVMILIFIWHVDIYSPLFLCLFFE
jgi:hypothetical protein